MDEVIEVFDTVEEADAFVNGLEVAQNLIDDDHLSWEGPQQADLCGKRWEGPQQADLCGKRWEVRVRFAA
jgi:hypothetical protein